jgi:hypothetical protein
MKQHLQRKCIKSQDMRLTFYTFREKKFPYGNFFSFVLGAVQAQIVGKTKFFDSLKKDAFWRPFCCIWV